MKTSNMELSCVARGMVAALSLQGCVDLPELGSTSTDAPPSVVAAVDPPPDDPLRVAPVAQFHLASADPAIPVDAAVVARGELAERDLAALAAGQPSPSLQRRIVAALTWRGRDGELVVAPTTAFEEGETISVGVPARSWAQCWTVAEDDSPHLERVWPVDAEGAWTGHAVWCERAPSTGWAPSTGTEAWLGPELAAGRMGLGMLEGYGADCVRWDAAQEPIPSSIMPPPWVNLADGRRARLDPEPLSGSVQEAPLPQDECPGNRTPIGAGCGEVQDDRVLLFGHSPPALIGIEISGKRSCGVPTEDEPLVIRGLVPNTRNEGLVVFLDWWGRRYEGGFAVRTGEAEAHVVINEVMANPAGAEPEQEWVELYNDGAGAVDLGGWHLEDIGLAAELPSFVLEPGKFALVVNDAFEQDSWTDRNAVPGTPLLRVPHLGKGGLSNAGEPLRLVRDDGAVASTVPAIASSGQSVSVARITPDASDSAASFQPGKDGGTPGGWNGTMR